MVSESRETEDEEKDEGSLSASIVPMKDGELIPRDPSAREGKSCMETCSGTYLWTCNSETYHEPESLINDVNSRLTYSRTGEDVS